MEQQASVEQIYCALLFLLSRHARSPKPHLPGAIRDHLHWLAAHADAYGLRDLRDTCNRLVLHWHSDHQSNAVPSPPVH